MSIQFYNFIHFVGIIMVFLSFGGLVMQSIAKNDDKGLRRLGAITNGIGLLLVLVAGFGLWAKLKIPLSGWLIVKVIIWFVFGGLVAVINRKPDLGKVLWWVILALGILAVVMVTFRPF